MSYIIELLFPVIKHSEKQQRLNHVIVYHILLGQCAWKEENNLQIDAIHFKYASNLPNTAAGQEEAARQTPVQSMGGKYRGTL